MCCLRIFDVDFIVTYWPGERLDSFWCVDGDIL